MGKKIDVNKIISYMETISEIIKEISGEIKEDSIKPEISTKPKIGYRPITAALESEIEEISSVGSFFRKNKKYLLSQNLSEHLNALLKQKGLKIADVVRGSLLDRVYVYQIFSGKKTPSRDKLIAISFGLGLSADETQKMLKLSGNIELYARDERDVIILFALQRGKNIFETNDLLHSYNFKVLGVTNLDD